MRACVHYVTFMQVLLLSILICARVVLLLLRTASLQTPHLCSPFPPPRCPGCVFRTQGASLLWYMHVHGVLCARWSPPQTVHSLLKDTQWLIGGAHVGSQCMRPWLQLGRVAGDFCCGGAENNKLAGEQKTINLCVDGARAIAGSRNGACCRQPPASATPRALRRPHSRRCRRPVAWV